MSNKHKQKTEQARNAELDFEFASFSIISIKKDQDSHIPTQRILQVVHRGDQEKRYVTESNFCRNETYSILAAILEISFENSVARKVGGALKPTRGIRHWVHFNEDTVTGKKQERVNPENFE